MGEVHELRYFFGVGEMKVKDSAGKKCEGETVGSRYCLVLLIGTDWRANSEWAESEW